MSKFITVVTPHFVFIYCLLATRGLLILGLLSNPPLPLPLPLKLLLNLPLRCPLFLKFPVLSLVNVSILTIILSLESVISVGIFILPTSSTSIKSSPPFRGSYLWFPRLTIFVPKICLRYFIEPYLQSIHILVDFTYVCNSRIHHFVLNMLSNREHTWLSTHTCCSRYSLSHLWICK